MVVAPHRAGVCPPTRGGEAHPPYIEDIVECGHLHHHGRTVALTHGELPLHPNYGYPSAMLRAQRRRETMTEGGWAELPDEMVAKVLAKVL